MNVKTMLLLSVFSLFQAEFGFTQDSIFSLWTDELRTVPIVPDGEVLNSTEIQRFEKVTEPTLEVFLPSKRNATGQAVLICPGGGYKMLAYDWEGTDIAKWLNTQGMATFVLKYRLPNSLMC